MHVYIKAFGCQMNVYDSQRILNCLERLGYSKTEDPEKADIIILNTCHIREKAAEKLYSEIGRLSLYKEKRKLMGLETLIIIVGCVVQAEQEELLKRASAVDIALGPQNYHLLPTYVTQYLREHKRILKADFPTESKFDSLPLPNKTGIQAFLAIQEGCDNFCSYCVVPYTRGCEYSRSIEDILKEAQALISNGAKEIMLLGQNVNCWHGLDKQGKSSDLGDLISHLSLIKGLERIRYTTSYPSKITESLIQAHKNIPQLMPYIHLPIQSGSNSVLKNMNRKYTAEEYLSIIERFRKARPDIAISSDFIVGFPGETESDFEKTLQIIKEVQYANSFSFKFSPRPGTPASLMKNQLPENVKTERLKILQALLCEQQKDFNLKKINQTLAVLFTERTNKKENQYIGQTPYMQTIHLVSKMDLIGKTLPVAIKKATLTSLSGEIKD